MALITGNALYVLFVLCATKIALSNARLLQEPRSQPEIVYMHYGNLQDYQALGALHALHSNPAARVTVIMDQNSNEAQWRQLAHNTNLNLYKPSNYSVVNRFKSIYKHSSVNQVQKEVFCIYRHLLLHQYMVEHNVDSLVYLDLDIVVFNDEMFKIIPPDATISPLGTFAVHWTKSSLPLFARFIWHFYERDLLEIARHIAAIGKAGPDVDNKLAESKIISEWWPDGVPRRHISDMRLFRSFVLQTGALQILCQGNRVSPTCPKALHLIRNAKQHPLVDAIDFSKRTEAVKEFQQAFDWMQHAEKNVTMPVLDHPKHGVSTVPGMHFQGHSKNVMPEILCPNLVSFIPGNVVLSRICTAEVLKAAERFLQQH